MRTNIYFLIILLTGISVFETVSAAVDLRYFAANRKGDVVRTEWTSNLEYNNLYYTIERSRYGSEYEVIGYVEGPGHSNEIIDYFFNDENPSNGDRYYRLKMIDFEGVITYSDAVLVKGIKVPKATFNFNISVPVSSSAINLNIQRLANPDIKVRLFSIDGRTVLDEDLYISSPGSVKIDLPQNILDGIHILSVSDGISVISERIFVKH